MKKLSMRVKIVICLGLALLAFSCGVSKKIQVANILKQCDFSFKRVNINEIKGDSLKFTVFLRANNKGTDSLFAQELKGKLYLDSLFEIPISLQNSVWLSPGDNELSFSAAIQLDFFKILALPTARKFTVKGTAFVALKPEQEATEISFSETKDIPPDLVEKQLQNFLYNTLPKLNF